MDQKTECRPRSRRNSFNATDLFWLSDPPAEVEKNGEIEEWMTPEQKLKRGQDMAARTQLMLERLKPVLEKLKR
jgi:hypothetical protein